MVNAVESGRMNGDSPASLAMAQALERGGVEFIPPIGKLGPGLHFTPPAGPSR